MLPMLLVWEPHFENWFVGLVRLYVWIAAFFLIRVLNAPHTQSSLQNMFFKNTDGHSHSPCTVLDCYSHKGSILERCLVKNETSSGHLSFKY